MATMTNSFRPPWAVDETAFDRLFDKTIVCEDGCYEFTGSIHWKGYGSFRYKGKTVGAHVAAFDLCCADLVPGMVIRHTCNNRKCVNPDHLVQGTHQDNSDDMTRQERQSRGINRPEAKLSEPAIHDIRKLHRENVRTGIIATKYDITRATVLDIVRLNTWKHVKDTQDGANV